MKKISIFVLASLLSSLAFAHGDLGVGAMLGQPTGVSAKKILPNGQSWDGGLGWSLGGNTTFQIHSDYLFNRQDALYWNDKDPLDVYGGAGLRMKFADDIELGVRVPVGVAYYTSERQLEFFGELAPILDLLPDTDWELHMLAGFRYYL